jgi:curli production assembly/transport component CsgG
MNDTNAPMVRRLSCALVLAAAALGGCATTQAPATTSSSTAQLTPGTAVSRDLFTLPEPKGKVAVAVYGFRDQTGQYKPSPDSSFSTAVTQGATSLLVKALKDSGWFLPVERENLQNLLTERKIVRALETPQPQGAPQVQVPALTSASVLVEGGVVAYESNVRSGGIGAQFLGIGLSTLYRVDQVTVNLRSIDVRNGQVLDSVSTTKTIYSYEVRPSVFKFIDVKDLVEFEAGLTRNEPAQLCVTEAIEAAVVHLVVQGLKSRTWALKNDQDWYAPLVQRYLRDRDTHYGRTEVVAAAAEGGAGTLAPPADAKPAASQGAAR